MFKRRVKGAYFAILTQALAAALAILLVGQPQTGGFNGLNDFRTFFGFDLYDPVNKQMLYFIAAGVLLVVRRAWSGSSCSSRYGELLVAVRDAEERVRFLGYDPANIKLVAYVVGGAVRQHRRGAVRARSSASSRPPRSASCRRSRS